MMNKLRLITLTALIVTAGATSAHAHGTAGVGAGFLHPITGIDHLLALMAVGVLAGRSAGKSVWAIPVAYLAVMATGAAIAFTGIAIPGTETAILASVAILIFVAAIALRLSPAVSVLVTGAFAFFHGAAHGAEMGLAAPVSVFAGSLASATLVMLAGIAAGRGLEALRARCASRA
jgi:urease accessory protein